MKKCLIIGIDSFTGYYLKEVFEENGFEVFGTVLALPDVSVAKNLYVMDLLHFREVADVIAAVQPQIVIHLAGISFTANDDVDLYYTTHILGTHNLLRAIAEQNVYVEKIILASTAQVYGWQDGLISERTESRPRNDYAVSKLAMENMARLWFDKLPIIIVRPFNYTGIGQNEKFVIPKLVNAFKGDGVSIAMGNIDVFRDFSDVRFIAKAYLALVKYGKVGDTYNLCSGRAISLGEIISILTEISGRELKIKVDPAFVRKDEPKVIVGNNEKLLSIMSDFLMIELRDTLAWMYAS